MPPLLPSEERRPVEPGTVRLLLRRVAPTRRTAAQRSREGPPSSLRSRLVRTPRVDNSFAFSPSPNVRCHHWVPAHFVALTSTPRRLCRSAREVQRTRARARGDPLPLNASRQFFGVLITCRLKVWEPLRPSRFPQNNSVRATCGKCFPPPAPPLAPLRGGYSRAGAPPAQSSDESHRRS
jgi:hypothetical protein